MMHENKSCQCDVCKVPRFERNNYFHGKVLNARDFTDEQTYGNEKRWLINRTILGWGIVCGLEACLDGPDACLVVKPGLAVDCCGHEILVCQPQTISPRRIAEALGIVPGGDSDHATRQPPADYSNYSTTGPIPWALCLEYQECRTEPVKLPGGAHGHQGRGYNRIRDDYRLSVRHRKDACPEDHSEDSCPDEGLGRQVPLHKALVERSLTCPKCEDCECVLIATGTLEAKNGEPPSITLDDDFWKYRRIVYTNPTLASVIRCFHDGLAHIAAVNWEPGSEWDVDEFFDRLCRDHLKVTFDQPMNEHSVKNPRSCRLSILLPTNDGHCPVQVLIPVDHIEYTNCTATYYFDDDCIEHELRRSCKKLKKAVEVELILRGSMVHNKNGRALDAEMIHEFPTGNGVEGGDFIAYFTVGP